MAPTAPLKQARKCNRLIALTSISLLCGCSSFETKWKAAAPPATLAAPQTIEGRWHGTWESEGNHHSGELRCIITRTGDESFNADYHASYWKIFQFGYSMPLMAKPSGSGSEMRLEGDADLGWLAGGAYHYEGHASPLEYVCTYRSKTDHGIFKMTRP